MQPAQVSPGPSAAAAHPPAVEIDDADRTPAVDENVVFNQVVAPAVNMDAAKNGAGDDVPIHLGAASGGDVLKASPSASP